MDLLKALKRTTILSAAAVLAFGATQARAAAGVSVLGHISASVQGTLQVTEAGIMNFGNFTISCGSNCTPAADYMVLSDKGQRTVTDGTGLITPLNNNVGGNGVANGTPQETGAQEPGFFTILQSDAATEEVYVTFADNAGNIIDANHPSNKVTLTAPPGGGPTFTVDSFTFEGDDGTTGYVTKANDGLGQAGFGTNYVTCSTGTNCPIRVGATLHAATTAATYTPGKYYGTYFVMVSY